MDMSTQVDRLAGWTPIRLYREQSSAFVDWCYLGERRFTDPFFDQTVEQCLRHPFNLLFRHQTPIEALGQRHESHPGLPPAGFIFHLSRCGSTLVTQMLAALAKNVVISEAAPIDSVLRARFKYSGVTEETTALWLRWVISALGQQRSSEEKYLFIKFDSWSALDLKIVKQAFPGVPWIFLYRDPVEIMVSQLGKRGAHMLPGMIEAELLGMEYSYVTQIETEEFCARVLASVCDAALKHHKQGEAMFVNYRQLPDVVWSTLLDFFHVEYTAAEIDRMRHASRFDAKNPLLHFEVDTASKNRQATREVRDAANTWVMPLYERLEAIRLSLRNRE
jgi:hypothetical protein